MSDALIDSLTAAVEARPDDLPLRLHLAELLVAAGRGPEAIAHAAQVLSREPANATAQHLMAGALGAPAAPGSPTPLAAGSPAAPTSPPTSGPTPSPDKSEKSGQGRAAGIDWAAM